MACGHKLKWFELIPIISWIALRGKCRSCKAPISPQYPIVETANGLLWAVVFVALGAQPLTIFAQMTFTMLIALSVIDARTHEIPVGFNIFIGILGVVYTILDTLGLAGLVGTSGYYVYFNKVALIDHLIGMVCVFIPLYLIFIISKGTAIGGGDLKLMAAAGLLIGWKLIVLAALLGFVFGAVIHVIRMKFFNAGRELAMGPYLSAGIIISTLFGSQIINTYLSLLGL